MSEMNDSDPPRVRSEKVRAVLVIACLTALAMRADAGGWPTPAAGPTMTGDPEILFTFDDGPNKDLTPIVLDTLAKYQVKAVFFMVGRNAAKKQAPAIIDRMLREGHIIANHTMTHQDLCQLEDPVLAAKEIDDGRAAIEAAAGTHVTWFRTPYGARCQQLEAMLAERGITHFHWDLDPQEWRHRNKKKTVEFLTKRIGRMTGRNVLLMHDMKRATVEALPEILEFIQVENEKRKETRRRRIRILQGWEIAIEQLPPGTVDWVRSVVPSREQLASTIASVLP